jgi:hypothetical protein
MSDRFVESVHGNVSSVLHPRRMKVNHTILIGSARTREKRFDRRRY